VQYHSLHSGASKELAGRIVAAGKQSVEAMAHLLGVDEAGPGFKVQAVAWMDHALEVSVLMPDAKEAVFRIERRSEDSEGLVQTERLTLYYRGHTLPEPLSEAVTAHAGARLERYSIHDLSAIIGSDPELGRPGLPMPPGVDETDRPRSLLDTWGGEDVYADFFAGGEIARSQLDTVDVLSLFWFVQHSDNECVHVYPHGVAPTVWLTNFPWDERIRDKTRLQPVALLSNLVQDPMLTTDLNEHDVVMGNPEKVRDALERVGQLVEKKPRPFFFSNTCVPVVTGEDVESELKRWRETHKCPLLYLTVSPRSMTNVFEDILVTRRLEAEQNVAPAGPNVINLVGFPNRRDVSELRVALEAAGVEVNVVLLPELSYDLVDQLPRAALNVYYPNQTWQHLYDQLMTGSRIPSIVPPAPYGIRSSREWISTVVEALGLEVDTARVFKDLYTPHADGWSRARKDADRQRLAMVVRSDETYYLTRPAATWGVPVLSTLEEMGFGLDVFLKLDRREQAYRTAKKVQDRFAAPDRHVIKGFNSMDLLLKRLRESRAAAVLSYHFYDWRVTQSGKNLFSLMHFEMGIQGAIRTAERLMGICRTPFYQRYARYLGRTPEGLRRSGEDVKQDSATGRK
jgi:hypothetical protein